MHEFKVHPVTEFSYQKLWVENRLGFEKLLKRFLPSNKFKTQSNQQIKMSNIQNFDYIKITHTQNSKNSTRIEKIFCQVCVEEIIFQHSSKQAIDRHIQKSTHQINDLLEQVKTLNKILNEKNEEISKLEIQLKSFNQHIEILNLKTMSFNHEKEIMELKIELFHKKHEISDLINEINLIKSENKYFQEKLKFKSFNEILTFPSLKINSNSKESEINNNYKTQTFHDINNIVKLHNQHQLDKISLTKTIVKIFIELGIPLNTLKDQDHSFIENTENDLKTLNENIGELHQQTTSITIKEKSRIIKKKVIHPSPLRILFEKLSNCSLYKIKLM